MPKKPPENSFYNQKAWLRQKKFIERSKPGHIAVRMVDGQPIDPVPEGGAFAGYVFQHQPNTNPFPTEQPIGSGFALQEPENWDYKNPPKNAQGVPLNQFGNALPKGAEAWDANGNAYYGDGIDGWINEVNSKAWEGIDLDNNPLEVFEVFRRGLWETAMGVLGLGEKVGQGAVAVGLGVEDAGEGSALPEVNLSDYLANIPGLKPDGRDNILRDLARTALGTVGQVVESPYNFIRMVTAPGSTDDKIDKIGDSLAASRIAFTGLTDSVVREEYIRRMNGENPYLLATELQAPWVEFWASLALDPTNLVGGGVTKSKQIANTAELMTDVAKYAPDVSKALDGLSQASKVSSLAKKAQSIQDLMAADHAYFKALDDLSESAVKIAQETGQVLKKSATPQLFTKGNKGLRSLTFALTAEARQGILTAQTSTFMEWVIRSSRNADGGIDIGRAADIMAAMVKRAGDDVDVAAEGLNDLLRWRPEMGAASHSVRALFSKAAYDSGYMLKSMIGGNADDFIEGLMKAAGDDGKNITGVIEYMDGKTSKAAQELYPSVTDGEKAAEAFRAAQKIDDVGKLSERTVQLAKWYEETVPRYAKTMNAWNNAAMKIVGPINRFFAGVYMGLSPAFAFRNALQNTFHVVVDYDAATGLRAFAAQMQAGVRKLLKKDPLLDSPLVSGALDDYTRWTGQSMRLGKSGYMATSAPGGKSSFAMLGVSNAMEDGASVIVKAKAARDVMRQVMKRGAALPDIQPLIDAGLSSEVAALAESLIIENAGDVTKALNQLRTAQQTGSYPIFRNISSWLSADDVKALNKFMWPNGKNFFDELDSIMHSRLGPDEAIADINDMLERFRQFAKQSAGDVTPLDADDADVMQKVVDNADILDDNTIGAIQNRLAANSKAFKAINGAARKIAAAIGIPQSAASKISLLGDDVRATYNNLTESMWKWSDVIKKNVPDADKYDPKVWRTVSKLLELGGKAPTSGKQFYARLNEEFLRRFPDAGEYINRAGKTLTEGRYKSAAFRSMMWDGYWRPKGIDIWTRGRKEALSALDDWAKSFQKQAVTPEVDQLMGAARKAANDAKRWDNVTPVGAGRYIAGTEMAGKVPKFVSEIEEVLAEIGKATQASQDAFIRLSQGTDTLDQYVDALKKIYSNDPGTWETIAKKLPDAIQPVINPNAAPTLAQAFMMNADGVEELFGRILDGVNANWGKVKPVVSWSDEAEQALIKWGDEAADRINYARLKAVNLADNARDFTFLSYNKNYLDAFLSYIFPYQYWYSRTYKNWMARALSDPKWVIGYMKYKEALAAAHADLPDWWKNNINTNELFGLDSENPMYFNLEATLWPLNGITGVDFYDKDKRVNWWTSALDDLGKFGPTVWTPFQMAAAAALAQQGEMEAAQRWANRLFPQTASIKALTAIAGIGPKGGLELDPITNYFFDNNGLDPYERRRVGRALGMMVEQGMISEEAALEAARTQRGDDWDNAKQLATEMRGPGQLSSFFFGVGFKIRSKSDMEIDKFYNNYNRLWAARDLYSADEFARAMDEMHFKYPFMDAVLLSRKGGAKRDSSYAYSVLSRIPPGQKTEIMTAVGIDPALSDKFWNDKGDMSAWPETDRTRFMNAMIDLGALLKLPSNATRVEWTGARNAYSTMMTEAETLFGADIWDLVDTYYAAKGQANQYAAEEILRIHPQIEQAMDWKAQRLIQDPALAPYYGGIENIRSYYKGLMYNEIEKALGDDIFSKLQEYYFLKDSGMAEEASDYYKANPQIKKYYELKEQYDNRWAGSLISVGSVLQQPKVTFREDAVNLSVSQQNLVSQITQQVPKFTWDEWRMVLPDPLEIIAVRTYRSGGTIPDVAMDEFRDIAERFGIPVEEMFREMYLSLEELQN